MFGRRRKQEHHNLATFKWGRRRYGIYEGLNLGGQIYEHKLLSK
jgi:hypothetical protein